MSRKTNVRSYERRDGTKVKQHERKIDSSNAPKVNSDSYKPPKQEEDEIASIRITTNEPESSPSWESSYYRMLEWDFTPDSRFIEFMKRVEGNRAEWDRNVKDSVWSGMQLSIEAPRSYIRKVYERYHKAFFDMAPKNIAAQADVELEWGYWTTNDLEDEWGDVA